MVIETCQQALTPIGSINADLPADNEPNAVADLQPEMLGDIKITYVRTLDEVLEHALAKEPVAPPIVPEPTPRAKRTTPPGTSPVH